uniref:Uncharacterized protein n=1 Tax=Triticum urartu TaxID=4572 RepID=A0A8R7PXT2_TRIUA
MDTSYSTRAEELLSIPASSAANNGRNYASYQLNTRQHTAENNVYSSLMLAWQSGDADRLWITHS